MALETNMKHWLDWFYRVKEDNSSEYDPEIEEALLMPIGDYIGVIESIMPPHELKRTPHMFFVGVKIRIEGRLKYVGLGAGYLPLIHLVTKTLAPHILGRSVLVRCRHRKIAEFGPTYEQFDIREWK